MANDHAMAYTGIRTRSRPSARTSATAVFRVFQPTSERLKPFQRARGIASSGPVIAGPPSLTPAALLAFAGTRRPFADSPERRRPLRSLMLQSGRDSEVVMLNARRLVVGFAAIVVTATLMFAASSFQGQAVAPPLAAAEAGKAGSDAVQASTDGATRLVAVMTQSSLDLRQLNPKPGEQVIVDVFVTM